MSETRVTVREGLGQVAAVAIGFGCLAVGFWGMYLAVAAPFWGLTWWVLIGSFVVACFGTAYAAFALARGERPQPWPSRIAAGACFIVGGFVIQSLIFADPTEMGRMRLGSVAFAGVMLLLGIAHGILGGNRPAHLLVVAAVCAAIVAYVCGPGHQFYSP